MTGQGAQRFGELKPMKVTLSEDIRKVSVIDLNRALADSIVLRDLYKKITGRSPARHSSSCISCSTNIKRSRAN